MSYANCEQRIAELGKELNIIQKHYNRVLKDLNKTLAVNNTLRGLLRGTSEIFGKLLRHENGVFNGCYCAALRLDYEDRDCDWCAAKEQNERINAALKETDGPKT